MKESLIDGGIIFTASIIQAFIHATILNNVFNTKINTKEKLIYASLIAIYATLFKSFVPLSFYVLNPIFLVLIGAIILLVMKKIPFLKGVLYGMFLIVISIPLEIIGGTVAANVFNLASDTDDVVASIPILVFIILSQALIALCLHGFKKLRKIRFQIDEKIIGMNIIWAFFFFIPNITFYAINKYNYPIGLLLYNIFANTALVILTIYNTYKHIQLKTTERDLQNSKLQNKNLKEINDSIRIFKHDYNNVVHALGGYIALEDMKGLEKYYVGLKNDTTKVNQLECITPEKINEPSVYGIIASKFQLAESKQIKFNLESMINYQNLSMPIYDFCKIIGVLLDNAIEAAEETEEKEINISVRQSNKTTIQLFSIENTYLNKDIDINKLYEKDYSTKNRNSGLGLWEVKNIVDRNKNVTLVTDKNEKYFKQDLYIQMKENHI